MNAIPNISRLSPRIVRILGCNPGKFTLQGTNTYLLGTGRQRILLDTGEGRPEYTEQLTEFLKAENIEISTILITHWHFDHTGGTKPLLETLSPTPQAFKYGDPDGFSAELDDVQSLYDGQRFSVPGATVVCHHTPGHATDHIVFWLEEEDAMFSGDNVLGEGTTVFTDLREYVESLNKMLLIGDGKLNKIYPGHGPVVEDGPAKIRQYISHRVERENQIVEILRQSNGPISLDALMGIIYKDVPKEVLEWARRGIVQHLDKLSFENRAVEDASGDWTVAARLKL